MCDRIYLIAKISYRETDIISLIAEFSYHKIVSFIFYS